jgi:hypothetical protein
MSTESMTLAEYERHNGKTMKYIPVHGMNGKRVTLKDGVIAKGRFGKDLVGGTGAVGYVWTVVQGLAVCHFGAVNVVQANVSDLVVVEN